MKKLILPLMVTVLLAGCNETTVVNNKDFSPEQKAQIEKIASQYIIEHPEVLVKASETLQKQQMEKQVQSAKQTVVAYADQLIKDAKTPYVGPKDAKVNVIEFFDYQCMFCSKISPIVKQLEAENPDVKFIFKETPIFASRWEASKYAADMGNWIFAHKGSDLYSKYHNAVFASGKDEGKLTKQDVNDIATKLGIDISKFDANNSFEGNFQLFSKLGFQGTPALIVMPTDNVTTDNVHIINGYDPQGLKDAIAEVKSNAK
ncbi:MULTISPECIES: thioredoxin domain-containing protein [unclassified Photobacterium]|uniref:DsbA family protein n=1 Tax=unclassified Photobacterium TaxID=2628852 RepID=UPI000D179CEF|nr:MULTISPECIES: thioredoxin domain-containing protein [unclassified Photobacterium]PSV27908.1 disulfide bond formation protein DsbA [Photobacterium sp. GB-56]PSV36282.1 disulfide bond formation protein DsbA [Photobacterium sp. GB-210]